MTQIPGIYVPISADLKQLKSDMGQAKQIITDSANSMTNALNGALSGSQAKKGVTDLTANLSKLSQASKNTGADFSKLGVDLGKFQGITGTTAAQFAKLQSQMLQTQAAKAQEKALKSIATAAGLTQKEITALGKQFGLSNTQIANVSGATQKASTSMNLLGGAAKAALAYLSASTIYSFGKEVVDITVKVDSLQRSFTAITGSTAGMSSEFEFLRETAERTGQNFYNLTDGYKNLIASSRDTQLEGEKTRQVFSAMTEAASVLGMSQEGVDRSLKALSQMMSKGTVQAEELKGQLGDHLPGALNIAANAMGVSTKQLMKMMEAGDVLASELLPKMAEELHKMYGAASETAALESGQAAVNRLSQAWTDFKANLVESDSVVSAINKITSAINAIGEAANLRSVWGTYQEGAKLAQKGLIDFQKFSQATFTERQKMVDDIINSENVAANHFGTVWGKIEAQGMREYQQYLSGHEAAVSSAYERAYGIIGGMTDDVYNSMKQKYAEDRDAFIALTGDKATAQAVYLKKIEDLDNKKNKTVPSKASDLNAALQAEVELVKAAEERKLAEVQASVEKEQQINQNNYDLGLSSYSAYLETKNSLTQKALKSELEAAEAELAAAESAAAKLSPITDKEGNARPDKDAKAYADAMKKVEDAKTGVIKAEAKLQQAEEEGGQAAKMAAKERADAYSQTAIQLLEMQGKTIEAAQLQAEYDEESVERQRLIREAAEGSAEAQAALDAQRLMSANQIRDAELSQLEAKNEALLSLAEIDGEYYKSLDIQTQLLDIEIQRAQLAGELPEQIALLQRQRQELERMKQPLSAFVKGWEDVVKSQKTASEQMYDLATETAQDLQDAFSDTFFNVMKGDFESIGDVWEDLLDRMLDNFIRMLADMAAAWAANEVFEFIFGSSAGASFSVSGKGGSSGGTLVGGVASMAVQAAAKKYLVTPAYNAIAEYIGGTAMSSTAAATGGSVAAGATSTSIGAGTASPAIMDAYATGVGAGATAAASGAAAAASTSASIGAGTATPAIIDAYAATQMGTTAATGAATTAAGSTAGGASVGTTAASMSAYAGPAAIAALAAAVMVGIATDDTQERDRLNSARITPTGVSELIGTDTTGTLTNMTEESSLAFQSLIGMMGSFEQVSIDAESGVMVLGDAIRDTSDAQTGLITGMNYQIETFNNATGVWEKSSVSFSKLIDEMKTMSPTSASAISATAKYVAEMNGIPSVADELAQAFSMMESGIYGLGGAAVAASGTVAGAIAMMQSSPGISFQSENERWGDTGLFDAINYEVYDGANAARDTGGSLRVTDGKAMTPDFFDDDYFVGHADGGVVNRLMVPDGEDGFAALRLGEGVIDTDTMKILSASIRNGSFMGARETSSQSSAPTVIHNHFYVDGKEISTTIMPAVDKHIASKASRGQLGQRTVF